MQRVSAADLASSIHGSAGTCPKCGAPITFMGGMKTARDAGIQHNVLMCSKCRSVFEVDVTIGGFTFTGDVTAKYGTLCPSCKGRGTHKCSQCNGLGYVGVCAKCNGSKTMPCDCQQGKQPCKECKGTKTTPAFFSLLKKTCPKCKGAGTADHWRCDGTGITKCDRCKGNGYAESCPQCKGTGSRKCEHCSGFGWKPASAQSAVPVPPAESNGDITQQLMDLLLQGHKIQAIKLQRECTGQGLEEAKGYVESLEAGLHAEKPTDVDLAKQLKHLLLRGRKIDAIKLQRECTGQGLEEAKGCVESLEAGLHAEKPTNADITQQLTDILLQGRKIDAVKLQRESTGQGLLEAKRHVDALEARLCNEKPAQNVAASSEVRLPAEMPPATEDVAIDHRPTGSEPATCPAPLDMKQVVWSVVSPLQTTLQDPNKIVALGPACIPVVIDVFLNPKEPTTGIASNQAVLACVLDMFARKGNQEAATFLRRIANDEVDLFDVDGQTAYEIAKAFATVPEPTEGSTQPAPGHDAEAPPDLKSVTADAIENVWLVADERTASSFQGLARKEMFLRAGQLSLAMLTKDIGGAVLGWMQKTKYNISVIGFGGTVFEETALVDAVVQTSKHMGSEMIQCVGNCRGYLVRTGTNDSGGEAAVVIGFH